LVLYILFINFHLDIVLLSQPSSSASTKNRQNATKGKAADLNHDNLILDDGSNEDDEELMSLSIKRFDKCSISKMNYLYH